MIKAMSGLALVILMLTGAPSFAQTPQAGQTNPGVAGVKASYGDWQMRCDTPPGAQKEQCFLVQNVMADDRPNVALSVVVLKTADQRERFLRVLAPLGVLLSNNLWLKIDGLDVDRLQYVRCFPTGCLAELPLQDAVITRLRTGKAATLIIWQTPEEGIGVPLSLAGFGDGFDKLP